MLNPGIHFRYQNLIKESSHTRIYFPPPARFSSYQQPNLEEGENPFLLWCNQEPGTLLTYFKPLRNLPVDPDLSSAEPCDDDDNDNNNLFYELVLTKHLKVISSYNKNMYKTIVYT